MFLFLLSFYQTAFSTPGNIPPDLKGPELSLSQLERIAKQADCYDDSNQKTETENNFSSKEKNYQSANAAVKGSKTERTPIKTPFRQGQGIQGDYLTSEEEKDNEPLLNNSKSSSKNRKCSPPGKSKPKSYSSVKEPKKNYKGMPMILQSEKIEIYSSSNYYPADKKGNSINFDSQNNSQNLIEDFSAKQMNSFLKGSIEHKMQKGSYGKPRYCKCCKAYKPDRCHHCSICNSCVLKMDHHCPFVNNCIGFFNYKYFINLLFYGSLMLNMLVFTFHEAVTSALRDTSVSLTNASFVVIVYAVMIVLDLVVTMFFFFHVWLLINGLSTIEFREKLSRNYRKVHINV